MKYLAYSLLLVVSFFASCNGHVKTNALTANLSEPKTTTNKHPRLVKTQGSNEYDNVYCGLLDKAGNLWFGTTGEGVYRYDGKMFTQFTIKDGLNSNGVYSILEDKSGNIWFGTTDGICRYDGENCIRIPINGNFSPSINNNNNYNQWATKNTVWSMLQDKSGIIWFGTGDGVYCYDGKIFTRFLDSNVINKDSLSLKMVACMLEDKNGNIWFGSGMPPGMEGICWYDGKSISRFKPNKDGWIRRILEDKTGNLLFATRHFGVCRYDGKDFTNITEKAGIDNTCVWTILEDKAANIWMGTELGSGELGEDGGLWRFDGKTFTKFTTKEGLCHNGVSCIVEDRHGNIWVGTRNTGLCRYDGKTFTNFLE